MATPTELSELEHGNGNWENIQEVLRFGFRNLWKAFTGMDTRVTELDKAFTAQKNASQRQQQHLEAIAQTLNAMSEQLRTEQEEAMNKQVDARLQHLECQLHDRLSSDYTTIVDENAATISKAERRLGLLEEEMGHVVSAIDQKADTEALLAQGRTLQEAMRERCKKEAFDQEVLALQERLDQHRQDLEKQLSASISDFKVAQETQVHSKIETWTAKTQENVCQRMQEMIGQEAQQQREVLGALDLHIKLCCQALESQQKRMDDFQVNIEKQVHLKIVADREDVARQCSEAHGRIDYQFRTQEESLERVRSEQHQIREEIVVLGSRSSQQVAAAVEDLDRRVVDREREELEKMHRQVTEEAQLAIANALKALEPAKDREQRKLRQQHHVVGRKLAELDQMMQLIGRQLIQNTSQLQVVRNEQLHLDLENEDAEFDDDELLLQYDNELENLLEVSQAPILPQPLQTEGARRIEMITEDTAELRARRTQHQELQEQLDKKLRDYSQVLDSKEQSKE